MSATATAAVLFRLRPSLCDVSRCPYLLPFYLSFSDTDDTFSVFRTCASTIYSPSCPAACARVIGMYSPPSFSIIPSPPRQDCLRCASATPSRPPAVASATGCPGISGLGHATSLAAAGGHVLRAVPWMATGVLLWLVRLRARLRVLSSSHLFSLSSPHFSSRPYRMLTPLP
jgi:hypothetical protein